MAPSAEPRLAKAALAMTFLAGLLIVSMLSKQMIGEWFDPGFYWKYIVDRQGREVAMPYAMGRGPIGPWTDLEGHELPDLNRSEDLPRLTAPGTTMEAPLFWSYRNSGRFYVECRNDTRPGNERWYYDQAQGRLVGRHLLPSSPWQFRPGWVYPARRSRASGSRESFDMGMIAGTPFAFHSWLFPTTSTRSILAAYDPNPVYSECGGTVVSANECEDRLTKHEWFVVGTEKSFDS